MKKMNRIASKPILKSNDSEEKIKVLYFNDNFTNSSSSNESEDDCLGSPSKKMKFSCYTNSEQESSDTEDIHSKATSEQSHSDSCSTVEKIDSTESSSCIVICIDDSQDEPNNAHNETESSIIEISDEEED